MQDKQGSCIETTPRPLLEASQSINNTLVKFIKAITRNVARHYEMIKSWQLFLSSVKPLLLVDT